MQYSGHICVTPFPHKWKGKLTFSSSSFAKKPFLSLGENSFSKGRGKAIKAIQFYANEQRNISRGEGA